jgi:membrane-associated phospholipid phosphatase
MRPQDRANVARFYAAVTPVGVFNDVYRQISTAQSLSVVENAHNLALVGMAINDAAIATFDSKYHYTFWRPETAIHNASDDGNDATAGDPSWTPFIVAPCFPGFPSAHGTLSNAAATVLEQILGNARFSVSLSNAAVPGVDLTYNNFTEITDDISDARVYGGIHFRTDQDAGASLGQKVGQYVYAHSLNSRNARAGCGDK